MIRLWCYLWNPKARQDSKGKVIDDIPRKWHIRKNRRARSVQMARGRLAPAGAKKHKVDVGGKINMYGGTQ